MGSSPIAVILILYCCNIRFFRSYWYWSSIMVLLVDVTCSPRYLKFKMLLLIWEVLSYESLYFLQMEIINMHSSLLLVYPKINVESTLDIVHELLFTKFVNTSSWIPCQRSIRQTICTLVKFPKISWNIWFRW